MLGPPLLWDEQTGFKSRLNFLLRDKQLLEFRPCFSIQFLFAEEYSKLNGNPSTYLAERNTWKCTTLQIYVRQFFYLLGGLEGLMVDCKASYLKVPGSNPIIFPWVSSYNFVSQLPLPPPAAASNSRKIKDDHCLPFCLLILLCLSLWADSVGPAQNK